MSSTGQRRKPSWGWKARGCAELECFTIPFAVKEYCQNQAGQVLKELRTDRWSDRERDDLEGLSRDEKQRKKTTLLTTYRSMFTGPHGVSLKHGDRLPEYVLTAEIARHRLTTPYNTDLSICTVIWRHASGLYALSFFNNHLDVDARFTSFVVDGESTSRSNEWAVGEKGKGFILATQFFHETIEKTLSRLTSKVPRGFKSGLSFRVGHHVGELKWKKGRSDGESDVLMVTQDDLTPLDTNGFMERRGRSTQGRLQERKTYGVSSSLLFVKEPSSPTHERNLVKADEVVITALGLPRLVTEDAFYYIYGILPTNGSWQFPSSSVQLYRPLDDEPLFYLRDQFVPESSPINHLGINYHGKLTISADRTAVSLRGDEFDAYRQALSKAADSAFRAGGSPELALEIWVDILSDSDGSAGKAYRKAFWDGLGGLQWRGIPLSAQLWSYPKLPDDLKLITELKKTASKTTLWRFTAERPGQSRLEQAINSILSHRYAVVGVSLRDYKYSLLVAAWVKGTRQFVVAKPGPLMEAFGDAEGVVPPTKTKIFRAFMKCMEGVEDMQEPSEKGYYDNSTSSTRETSEPSLSLSISDRFATLNDQLQAFGAGLQRHIGLSDVYRREALAARRELAVANHGLDSSRMEQQRALEKTQEEHKKTELYLRGELNLLKRLVQKDGALEPSDDQQSSKRARLG